MFNFLKDKLKNTARLFTGGISADLDEIEDTLISADLGVDYACELVEKIRKSKPADVKEFLRDEFATLLSSCEKPEFTPNIYLIVGVNGAGKTTLIGKLAYKLRQEGKKVLIAAADTFRAAAEEQLDVWAKRAGANIVRKDGGDPAAVVYEAIQKAQSYDVLIIDTAGRLQNKYNLMEELSKIKSVIAKNMPNASQESLLVIDANTGQNGLQQAKVFNQAVELTGVALTKLDGTAKGAIVLAIAKELGLPVKLIGVGEQIEDLREFDAQEFIDAIFD